MQGFVVRPLAGAGIEIKELAKTQIFVEVRPLAGAGIEILKARSAPLDENFVRPLAGAGIEIGKWTHEIYIVWFAPSRGRELKFAKQDYTMLDNRSPPRGGGN